MRTPPTTKIRRPDAGGLLARARLFRLLDSGRKQRILWVAAPAGSGKTSLATGYLASRGLPCLWYRADEGDADSATFYYYFGQAVRAATPRHRKPLPLFTPEYVFGSATFLRRFFEDAYSRLRPPFVFVIDDYQDVPEDSPFHGILQGGLELLPRGIRAIVLSRKEPPAPFLRDRVNGNMTVVGWEDLRFSPAESRKIVLMQGRRKLGKDILDGICREAEGWAAGLVLLAESGGSEIRKGFPRSRLRPEVFDYIAGEVFAGLNTRTKDFLLAASFLPSMTAASAGMVSARSDAAEQIAELHRSNFFTTRDAGPSAVYRFHPLFRRFLQDRAAALDRETLARMRKQTASALLQEGRHEEAAGLLAEAGDWAGLISIIRSHAPELIMQGRNRTLRDWIHRVPQDAAAADSWLLYWSGINSMAQDPAGSRATLEQALAVFQGNDDETGSLLAWSGIVQTFLFEFHDFRPLDQWADWIERRVRGGLTFPDPEIEASVVTGMTGIIAWRCPDLPDKQAWLDKALRLPHRSKDIDACMRAYTNSALYHVWMGDLAACGVLVHEMDRMSRSASLSPLRLLSLRITEAMLYNSSVDHQQRAERAVAEGLALAERTGVHLMSPTLFLQGVFAALNRGDGAAAADFLRRTERSVGEDRRINLSHYLFAAAWCALTSGEQVRAAALAGRSLQLIDDAGAPLAETLIRLVLAVALHAAGDVREAGMQLERAGTLSARTGSAYAAFLYGLTEAHLALERNDRESAFAALRRALETGRRHYFITLLYFWLPDVLGRLCGEAIEAGIETDYAMRLVRKLGLARDERTRGGDHWPWRLDVVTFGRFGLLRNGVAAATSGKTQKKPLLLLKAVIAAGPEGMDKEHLIDALWPDADGDAGNIAFHTTLSRLRKFAGDDAVIRFTDGIVTLDRRYCRVDSWAFERLVERYDASDGNGAMRDGIPSAALMADQAIALYKGIFLPADQDFLPALSVRERLRSKFLRLISCSGRSLEQAGELEAALDRYARGLEAEPLAEELHYGRISCYLRLERHAEAITAYQLCRKLLHAELGVPPSPRTELLMRQFRSR